MQIYSSGEDYLEAVLILQKKMGEVRSVDVARYVGVSKPSVCHAVNVLCDGGFLTKDDKHFIYLTEEMVQLAEKLASVLPGDLRRSFFCCTGSEANEGAMLLARLYTGKNKFFQKTNERS